MTSKTPPLVALKALFAALPPELAMARLVVADKPSTEHVALVERALADPELAGREGAAAGLWLYVDDLDRSHKISQKHEDDSTFCYWHAIMHRREGDFSNSGYWFGRTGAHPVMDVIAGNPGGEGYNARELVKKAEAAHGRGEAPKALVELQRMEWAALFGWCMK
ncbi:MAG: hypothetical protein NTW19_19580 [Planctomycetota bacterium]|nr:hypothetical protein [Planctomycetota bacterium]